LGETGLKLRQSYEAGRKTLSAKRTASTKIYLTIKAVIWTLTVLLQDPAKHKLAVLVIIIMLTGARIREVSTLTYKQIIMYESVRRKRLKQRQEEWWPMQLPEDVRLKLFPYLLSSYSASANEAIFADATRRSADFPHKMKLPEEMRGIPDSTYHVFRRTAKTFQMKALALGMDFLGHKSQRVTARYESTTSSALCTQKNNWDILQSVWQEQMGFPILQIPERGVENIPVLNIEDWEIFEPEGKLGLHGDDVFDKRFEDPHFLPSLTNGPNLQPHKRRCL